MLMLIIFICVVITILNFLLLPHIVELSTFGNFLFAANVSLIICTFIVLLYLILEEIKILLHIILEKSINKNNKN